MIVKNSEGVIVFVEVKARKSHRYGYGAEAVTAVKCQRIKRTSKQYIFDQGLPWNSDFRYDVIVIENHRLEHIVNAFY